MKSLLGWLGRNIDPILALVVALVIGTLEVVSNISQATISSGILLVLGVLAVAVLRDRLREDGAEQSMRAELKAAAELRPAVLDVRETMQHVSTALADSTIVRTLNGSEVARALADARRMTDRWIFRGGTGTYIRAKTLPECVANARRERRTLQIRLEIIDPTDERVCASYVRFRHSISGDESDWTIERAQREAYATIAAACYHRQRYELLDIQVGLSATMPTLRFDMSSQNLILTQESPNMPAMLIEHGKLLYMYLQTELSRSFEQARRVPLELAAHAPLSDPPTVDEIRKLFVVLTMPLPSIFTDKDVQDIANRALHAQDPYAS